MSISPETGVAAGPAPPTTPTQLFIGGTWRDASADRISPAELGVAV